MSNPRALFFACMMIPLAASSAVGCSPSPVPAPAAPLIDPPETPESLACVSRTSSDAKPPARSGAGAVPYALTISGGMSIGAFEAGATWATLKALRAHREGRAKLGGRHVELVGVAGASAGSINAMLAAAVWCQKDGVPDTVEENLFARSWLEIGLERLLPGRMTCAEYRDHFDPELSCAPGETAYMAGDGAFSRRPIRQAERDLMAAIRQPGRFDPGCRLPLGLTVTSERVEKYQPRRSAAFRNASIEVPNQLHSVVFRAEGSEGGLSFRQWLTELDPRFGSTLYVARETDGMSDAQTVFDVVEASSAFPIAFGMKTLRVCRPPASADARSCEPGGGAPWSDEHYFDGGIYDNVPLGLTMHLAEPPAMCLRGGDDWPRPEGVRFLFLDPDTSRHRRPHVGTAAPPTEGVPLLLSLLGRFVEVSRKQALQVAMRHLILDDRGSSVRPVTRLIPLMSGHAVNLGGFFARPFRQYDYLVGVYEGIEALARDACDAIGEAAPETRLRCIVTETHRLHGLLGLGASTPHTRTASATVRILLHREAEIVLGEDKADPFLASIMLPSGETAASFCAREPDDELIAVLLRENISLDRELRTTTKPDRAVSIADFERVLAAMREPVERRVGKGDRSPAGSPLDYSLSRHEVALFRDFRTWAWHRAARLTERLAVSTGSADPASRIVFGGLDFVMHQAASPEAGWWDWNGSTMSTCTGCGAQWARVVPFDVTIPRTGGLEIGYRINRYFGSHFGLTLALRPYSWTDENRRQQAKLGIGPLLVTGWAGAFSSLDLLANGSVAYVEGDVPRSTTWGVELGATHVYRHLRTSLSLENQPIDGRPEVASRTLFLRLGFSDLSSLVYWAVR
jgi:predicted acylesterase/phospholipase RssA